MHDYIQFIWKLFLMGRNLVDQLILSASEDVQSNLLPIDKLMGLGFYKKKCLVTILQALRWWSLFFQWPNVLRWSNWICCWIKKWLSIISCLHLYFESADKQPVRDIKNTKPPIHQFTNLKCCKKAREHIKTLFNDVLFLIQRHFHPKLFILKAWKDILQHFKFVNWWICLFVV